MAKDYRSKSLKGGRDSGGGFERQSNTMNIFHHIAGNARKIKYLIYALYYKLRLKKSYLDLQFWSKPTIYSPQNLSIGRNVAINDNFWVNASGGVAIGNNVLIGPSVIIHSANHNFSRTDIPIREQGHTGARVVIEDDVWLSARVTILPGVTIGKGAIIAAGAVVNKDVEPFTIVGGIPARLLKKR